ncbi:MAG: hypothetical protein H7338_17220 [Candidatus Sericytochromatia bacterium]|nr:hypothetical protein [Candidatus Sericytochromatia bacterium]
MTNQTVKTLSYGAFILGALSVIGSAFVFFRGLLGGGRDKRQTGLFLGLWAPTLFTLAEMLDRVSIEDRSYMGIPIKGEIAGRANQISEQAKEAIGMH